MPSHHPKHASRRFRIAALGALALVVLAIAATVGYLRVALHGENLANRVTDTLNEQIRGRVEAESITWPMEAIPRALAGKPIPLEVRHVRIYDELGDLVIETDLAQAELEPHPAMFGRRDLIIHDIALPEGGYALIRQIPASPEERVMPRRGLQETNISLVSALSAPPRPGFFAGQGGSASPIVDLRRFSVRDIRLEFAFPGERGSEGEERLDPKAAAISSGFYASARGVTGEGFFKIDGSFPPGSSSYFSLTADASRGHMFAGGIPFLIRDLEVERLAQLPRSLGDPRPRDLELRASGHTPQGARFSGAGALRDYLDDPFGGHLDIDGEIRDADSLARVLTRGAIDGDDLRADIRLGGRTIAPALEASVYGASFDLDFAEAHPPVPTTVPEATFTHDASTGRGRIDHIEARGAGGAAVASGSFATGDGFRFEGDVDVTEALEVRRYLPPPVLPPVGDTKLSGTLAVQGTIAAGGDILSIVASDLDMRLGRARIGGTLRYTEDERLHNEDLIVHIGDTVIRIDEGSVDFARDVLDDIRFSIRSRDFDDWLRRYEALPVMKTLAGAGRYAGPREDPRLSARLTAGEVPMFGDVDFQLIHRGQRALLREIRADLFGGDVSADGEFLLGEHPEILDFEAVATDVDLSEIPIVGQVLEGRVTAKARAHGSTAEPELALDVRASDDLAIAGERFSEFSLAARVEGGARSLEAKLARAGGGALDVRADVDPSGSLGGGVMLEDVDLASLALDPEGDPYAGGRLAAAIELGGTARAPELGGALSLSEGWFHRAHLGAAEITVAPEEPGVARLRGRLFEGLADITGTVETAPPYRADITIDIHRAELDRFLPELAEEVGARAWVSGRARVRGPLSPSASEPPEIDVLLHEAVVHMDRSDGRGRPRPVRLKNQTPIRVGFDGQVARIEDEVILSGTAGEFRVSGGGRPSELDLSISGGLDVELLAPYFQQQFDEVTGLARIDLGIAGHPQSPELSGTVDVEDIEVRLAGQDASIRAPAGKIEVTNDQLVVTGLTVEAADPYSDEVAELTVAGGVGLENFQPRLWALHVHGSLGGKLLLALLPEELSSARGAADLSLSLIGEGRTPNIDGELRFGTEEPIALVPRGMRRELLFDRGLVRFTDDLVEIDSVGGWVDDEGYVSDVSGEIGLSGGRPADIDVTLSAEDLPFRIPQTLELLLGLRDVRIVGDLERGIEIAGDVLVIDGRYIQDFNPLLDEIRPQRVVEESPAFYERIPILAGAELELGVETRSFFVRNNVASVALTGGLEITGTPSRPQLDGVVRVEDGSFQFQGVRAEFQETSGTVTFERYRDFPDSTPALDIRSESEYRDFAGEDHLVVLELTGPLGQLQWDLFTTGGLNKAQTFMLIVSGRTPEEARRIIGDESVVRGPGEFAGTRSTQDPDGNLAVVDQLVKDLAGDFFSLLIEDSIRNVTDLDVARLQLGTASVGFHGEKEFTRSFRVLGDLERSLRGWAWDVRGEYRLLDQLSVEGEYLHKDYDEDVEEDVRNFRVKAVWRWLIP